MASTFTSNGPSLYNQHRSGPDGQGVGRLDLALVYKHSNHESYNQTKNLNDALTVSVSWLVWALVCVG